MNVFEAIFGTENSDSHSRQNTTVITILEVHQIPKKDEGIKKTLEDLT